MARKQAERTKELADLIALRKSQAQLVQEIKQSKRKAFRNFLEAMDFRRDGPKAHRFISTLDNDSAPKEKEPFKHGGRLFMDPREIANLFCNHYANISRVARLKKDANPKKV